MIQMDKTSIRKFVVCFFLALNELMLLQQSDLGLLCLLKHSAPNNSCETNWPQGYKKFSCSTQVSMKFVLLINKTPTAVGILTFMSEKNSILG